MEEAEEDGHFGSGAVYDAIPPDDASALAFPTKLAVDPESGWLWIADSGHHRIVRRGNQRGHSIRCAGQ